MTKLKLLKTLQKAFDLTCIVGLIYALICIDTDQSWLRTWMSVGVFAASGVGALAMGNEIDYRRRRKMLKKLENRYIRATEICIAVAKRGQRISPRALAASAGIEESVAKPITLILEGMWQLDGRLLEREKGAK